jgi:capsular polysaccharide transport system permease protein
MDDISPTGDAEERLAQAKERREARRRIRVAMNDAAMAAAVSGKSETTREAASSGTGEGRKVPMTNNPGTAAARNGDEPASDDRKTALTRIKPAQMRKAGSDPDLPAPGEAGSDAFEVAHYAREARMRQIRKELRRRRRFRALAILLRFAIFVIIPTAAVGWYYYEKATDMYVSESTLLFKSGSSAVTGGGGLFSSLVGGGSPQDSVALQEYILSRDILKRLDQEHGWIKHFQNENIDEIHRLPQDATLDSAHEYYAGGFYFILPGKVAVSYDIAEGIIRLSVTAATPEAAKEFSDAIIGYGEELVNSLNDRSRNDGVRSALENEQNAREALRDAQRAVANVQEQLSIFSVESEAGALQGRIVALEGEIDEIFAEIEKLKTVTSNQNDSRFTPLRTNLEVKTRQLLDLRERLTGGTNDEGARPSMAKLGSELELARVDQATAQMMYASAITSLEAARASAAEQSLYLETVVQPTVPDKASKPERAQNTGLVFLVLFAIYIIGLLTISLIREQAAI